MSHSHNCMHFTGKKVSVRKEKRIRGAGGIHKNKYRKE